MDTQTSEKQNSTDNKQTHRTRNIFLLGVIIGMFLAVIAVIMIFFISDMRNNQEIEDIAKSSGFKKLN